MRKQHLKFTHFFVFNFFIHKWRKTRRFSCPNHREVMMSVWDLVAAAGKNQPHNKYPTIHKIHNTMFLHEMYYTLILLHTQCETAWRYVHSFCEFLWQIRVWHLIGWNTKKHGRRDSPTYLHISMSWAHLRRPKLFHARRHGKQIAEPATGERGLPQEIAKTSSSSDPQQLQIPITHPLYEDN